MFGKVYGSGAREWILSNWGPISLLEFRRPGALACEANLNYPGKRSLREAMEQWIFFQPAFKRVAFAGCTATLTALFVDADDHLAKYHSIFLRAELEVMIGSYNVEVGTRSGNTSKRLPQQALCNQADCVALLAL